jgi:hypothetical protein
MVVPVHGPGFEVERREGGEFWVELVVGDEDDFGVVEEVGLGVGNGRHFDG